MSEPEYYEYRIQFQKLWECRFISHLDLMRSLMRTMRRTGLPIYFTQGFNPKPKLSYLTPPLPVGATSECEIIDIRFEKEYPADEINAALTAQAPPGIVFHSSIASPRGVLKIAAISCLALVGETKYSPDEMFPPEIAEMFDGPPREVSVAECALFAISSDAAFRAEDFFTRAFILTTRHNAEGGSPLKTISRHFAPLEIPRHFHRIGLS